MSELIVKQLLIGEADVLLGEEGRWRWCMLRDMKSAESNLMSVVLHTMKKSELSA